MPRFINHFMIAVVSASIVGGPILHASACGHGGSRSYGYSPSYAPGYVQPQVMYVPTQSVPTEYVVGNAPQAVGQVQSAPSQVAIEASGNIPTGPANVAQQNIVPQNGVPQNGVPQNGPQQNGPQQNPGQNPGQNPLQNNVQPNAIPQNGGQANLGQQNLASQNGGPQHVRQQNLAPQNNIPQNNIQQNNVQQTGGQPNNIQPVRRPEVIPGNNPQNFAQPNVAPQNGNATNAGASALNALSGPATAQNASFRPAGPQGPSNVGNNPARANGLAQPINAAVSNGRNVNPNASAVNSIPMNDVQQLALQGLGGNEVQAAAQVQSVPQAQPAANGLPVGEWTAKVSGDVNVRLSLNANGSFTWTAVNKGQPTAFSGNYAVQNGTMTLTRSNDNQKLDGAFTPGQNGFNFRLKSAKDAGLNFVRG